MVMAQSLYRELRSQDPDIELHVLAPPWSLPVLERMPEVERGIELAVGHGELGLATRWRVGHALRQEQYSRAIILSRSLKAALVPYFARIPQRTGFRGEWRYGLINDMREFDPARLNQTVLRFLALGLPVGNEPLPEVSPPVLTTDPNGIESFMEQHDLALDGDVVAMMPGAEYGPAKQWPAEYYAELARRLAAVGFPVWILGSARESSLGDEICTAAGAKRVVNLCGATTLSQAIDLLSRTTVAVSNDSGLMHVAAAVGAHVIAIYGSSTPSFTPPLTEYQTIHYEGLACSPCFKRTCPLGHLNCLRNISVDAVFASIVNQVAANHADRLKRTAENRCET